MYVRSVDGGDATRIGHGQAQQFSPDGRWVLSVAHGPPVRLLLLPTGPGQARTVETGGVTVTDARWLPDARQLVLIGTEEGHGRRAYVMDVEGGSPRAISPEGVTFESNMLAVSPDGTSVVLRAPDRRVLRFQVDGSQALPVPGLTADEMPIGWTADSRSVLVRAAAETSRIDRVDITSGRRDRWTELRPPNKMLTRGRMTLALDPSRRSYAANYQRIQTELYLVERLR